jgi:Flp pilus assembly protein TadD
MAAVLVLCVAVPAGADKRLDDAVAKAEKQLAQGKPDEAVKTLQKAAEKSRRDPLPQLALASLLMRLGKRDEAGVALASAGDLAATAPGRAGARLRSGRRSPCATAWGTP